MKNLSGFDFCFYLRVRRLVEQLPRSHLIYLRHVMCVLHRIASHGGSNNMTACNLSVCVSQNLLWPPRRTGAAEMLFDVSRVSQICQRMIELTVDVFGPRCLELFGGAGLTTAVTDDDESLLRVADDQGTLQCDNRIMFSRPYLVRSRLCYSFASVVCLSL